MKQSAVFPAWPLDRVLATPWQDRLFLLGWAGILLACALTQTSLMAHDEGNYAAESRFMLESGQGLARQFWGEPTYSHGILLNWLILTFYRLFGVSDWAARLPAVLAALGAGVLTYEIGKILLASQRWRYARHSRLLALLAGMLLMVMSLWAQYGHLGTQDMLLVSTELLGIWALLKVEQGTSAQRLGFGFLAGVCLGLGYLIKTFMIFLPMLALLPYLVLSARRHLSNPGLYLGLATGIGAIALWLGLSTARYGALVWESMFGKLGELSEKPFHADSGPLYYLWNVPVNMMPWALFALIGAAIVLWQLGRGWIWADHRLEGVRLFPHRWLWLYPFLLIGLLTLFPTKTPYYGLQVFPFMALYGAIGLFQIATGAARWPRRLLSYGFAILAALLLGGALALWVLPAAYVPEAIGNDLWGELRAYAPLALPLGIGWLALPLRQRRPLAWLGAWLVPAWVTLCLAGLLGIFGNYSPELKAGLKQDAIAPIVTQYPVDFITGTQAWPPEVHKTFTLLSFYTPRLGQLNRPIAEIPTGTYAWLSPNTDADRLAQRPYETIAELENWRLIRL